MSFDRPRLRVALLTSLMLTGWAASATAQTETIEYYATDAVGSVRVVFDASGNVLGRMDYEPFGRELFDGLFPVTEHFGGQPVDGENGQGYFHARQYASRTGRFSRVDPIYSGLFEPQRWNRYAYSLNNSVRYQDPTGLDPINPCWPYDGCQSAPYIDVEADFWQGFQPMPPVYGELPLNGWLAQHDARYAERQAARAARGTGDDGSNDGGGKGGPGGGNPGDPKDDPPGTDGPTTLGCLARGAVVGAVGALAVGGLAIGAASVGVPAAVVTGVLFVGGVIGGASTVYNTVTHSSHGNYAAAAYDVGSFAGGAIAGSAIGGAVGDAIKSPATRGWSVFRDWDNRYLPSKGSLRDLMATGPDAPAAAGGTAASGAGVANFLRGGCS